jgi:hypothetical protein
VSETEPREWKPIFFEAFASTGNVAKACKKAGISRQRVYQACHEDEQFKALFDEARTVAVGLLEDEAWRRAKDGVRKPIYQKGYLVGYVREYSDGLLMFLLKANNPAKYRENIDVNLTTAPLLVVDR